MNFLSEISLHVTSRHHPKNEYVKNNNKYMQIVSIIILYLLLILTLE